MAEPIRNRLIASLFIGRLLTHKRFKAIISMLFISDYQLPIEIPVSIGYTVAVTNQALYGAGKGVNDGSV